MKKLKEVDVVIVGFGWTGGIMAQELSKTGLKIVALEKGSMRQPEKEFILPYVRDELKFQHRNELQQNLSQGTVTFRNTPEQRALPMRHLGSFLPGEGVGGAGLHWNGMTFRNSLVDHRLKSHYESRYGKKLIPKEMELHDWPQAYDTLEPYYDKFEEMCGVSGQAGNLKGKRVPGGNPFEAPRSNNYPNPPLEPSRANQIFKKAAQNLGLNPYSMPAANASRPYTNSYGDQLGQCQYCGHCEVFACETGAKASPNITVHKRALASKNFSLKTHSWVYEIARSKDKKKVTGVYYVDTQTGDEFFQPAETVFICTWTLNNVHLLLTSGIGEAYSPKTNKGLVGKNYCYQTMSGARVFFEKEELNTFMGAGALGMVLDDYNSDNFDHSSLGFLGGGFIANLSSGARPISTHPVPPGTPSYGSKWKQEVAKWYNKNALVIIHGANYPHKNNYLDLDPTYKNSLGSPLLRMTFDFQKNDHQMMQYLTAKTKKLLKAMKPTHIAGPKKLSDHYQIVPYQSTHNTGGAIMGTAPDTSVVNSYCQNWQYPNLFVLGASAFPQNTGYNPTGPLGALSFYIADNFKKKYMKKTGELM